MKSTNQSLLSKNFIPSVIIAIAIIITASIFAGAYKYKFKTTETITVTGLAEKEFVSDLITWSGEYQRKSLELKDAYRLIKNDEATVRQYLKSNKINDNEIVFSSITIQKEYTQKRDENGHTVSSVFTGFKLSQHVTVESKNIDKVELVSREVTKLIESGIEISSLEPSYFYTKLSELKIDLLAKASADAKKRAETIAENSGSSLGKILKADMGVFQITAPNSNESFSFGGTFNTSSKTKKATITIRINYAVK
ncbi:MAG: SIMPL domain-containing protein [Bacteroidota bacterium]|nr:SIMPL domain-containing protein [Bacteroidota bacterium]